MSQDNALLREHFGDEAQIIKAIEEMGELSILLARNVNNIEVSRESLIEEIADVYNMLEQLPDIFGIALTDIVKMQKMKTARTIARVKNEKNGVVK